MDEYFAKPGKGELSFARWMLGETERLQKLAEKLGVSAEDFLESNFVEDYSSGRDIALICAKRAATPDEVGPVLVWRMPISLAGGPGNNHLELGFGVFPLVWLAGCYNGDDREGLKLYPPWEPLSGHDVESIRLIFWPDSECEGAYAHLDWKCVTGSGLHRFVKSCADVVGRAFVKHADSSRIDTDVFSTEQGWVLAERLITLYVKTDCGVIAAKPEAHRKIVRRK